jgi:hypothetical protein
VPLSLNLGTLTSWNYVGHSRPVTGRLCFLKKEVVVNFVMFVHRIRSLMLTKENTIQYLGKQHYWEKYKLYH